MSFCGLSRGIWRPLPPGRWWCILLGLLPGGSPAAAGHTVAETRRRLLRHRAGATTAAEAAIAVWGTISMQVTHPSKFCKDPISARVAAQALQRLTHLGHVTITCAATHGALVSSDGGGAAAMGMVTQNYSMMIPRSASATGVLKAFAKVAEVGGDDVVTMVRKHLLQQQSSHMVAFVVMSPPELMKACNRTHSMPPVKHNSSRASGSAAERVPQIANSTLPVARSSRRGGHAENIGPMQAPSASPEWGANRADPSDKLKGMQLVGGPTDNSEAGVHPLSDEAVAICFLAILFGSSVLPCLMLARFVLARIGDSKAYALLACGDENCAALSENCAALSDNCAALGVLLHGTPQSLDCAAGSGFSTPAASPRVEASPPSPRSKPHTGGGFEISRV